MTKTAMPFLQVAAVVAAEVAAVWWQHGNGGSGSKVLATGAAWRWQ
jgi:hypothetical protein